MKKKTAFFKLKLKEKLKIRVLFPENIEDEMKLPLPIPKELFSYQRKFECSGKNCPFCEAGIPRKTAWIISKE